MYQPADHLRAASHYLFAALTELDKRGGQKFDDENLRSVVRDAYWAVQKQIDKEAGL